MRDRPDERWNAASGYLVIALGIAGAAFERGSPPADAPVEEMLAFVSTYRIELLAQSLMFVLSAGAYLWFFGALRSAMMRAEGGDGTIGTIAFGAGIVSVGLQMMLQVMQVGLAAGRPLDAAVAGLLGRVLWALSVIAYVPLAVVFAAVALVSFRDRAFPRWMAWFSAIASLAHLVMTFGLIADRGPLVPGGILTYVLYGIVLAWLIAVTTLLVFSGARKLSPELASAQS